MNLEMRQEDFGPHLNQYDQSVFAYQLAVIPEILLGKFDRDISTVDRGPVARASERRAGGSVL
jgi:hypothetical protein